MQHGESKVEGQEESSKEEVGLTRKAALAAFRVTLVNCARICGHSRFWKVHMSAAGDESKRLAARAALDYVGGWRRHRVGTGPP